MDAVLVAIEQSQMALFFRTSRWGYAVLNGTHITGIALLVGGILPLDLRLLGCWPKIHRRDLARVLVPTAATGLVIAVLTGCLLFSVRATEYATLKILWFKLALIGLGAASAVLTHARYGIWLDRANQAKLASVGLISILCWFGALASGRLIAFVQ